MTHADMAVIAPFLIVVVTGMVVLLWDLVLPRDRKGPLIGVSLLGILFAFFGVAHLWDQSATAFNGTITGDDFALLFQIVILIVTGLGVLLSEKYVQQKGINYGEYYALMIFSASGAMLMAAARELILIFIGLEILSIALYVLSGLARTEEKSEEAAVKYFLLGAFSSGFFLYGIALFYGGTGTTVLSSVPNIASTGAFSMTNPYTAAGIALLLVGLCFKAAIVPFHSWTPDVYQGAPTSVTAFMSAAAKAGAFAALIRVLAVVLPVSIIWHDVIWILAAATMIIGNVVALWQRDIKRMLAYSSIAHAGYILVGVLAGNSQGYAAVLFYMLVYTFMNLGAFGIVILLSKTGEDRSQMTDLQGLGRSHPFAAVLMTIFMFSLAGIPPLAGFIGKLYLFQAALEAHLYGLTILGLLASVVGVYYYLMVIVRMWMVPAEREVGELSWSAGTNIALVLSALATVFLLFFSTRIIDTFATASDSLNTDLSNVTVSRALPDADRQNPLFHVYREVAFLGPVDSQRKVQ
jgi:NADH-quinone oxidoreductase subunit N